VNILDWLLVVLTLAYGISGYWQGFVTGATATLGLLVGGALGIVLVPFALGRLAPSITVSLGALVCVLVSASIGQALGSVAGARARNRITWKPARSLDAIGGAALSMVAVLVVAWALGYAVSGTKLPSVSDQVRQSNVLSRIDAVMPDRAETVLGAFNRVVDSNLFPRYLEPFASEPIVEVPEPGKRVLTRRGVIAAEGSVVKVTGDAVDCDRSIEGSGFVYSDDRVMTNAHVIAGVDEPTVTVGDERLGATVVLYDPKLDIAVLAVDGLEAEALSFDGSAESEDSAVVLGFPENGPYDVQPARIRSQLSLRGPDIYDQGTVVREVYSVRALVRSGNSGGPLVSPRGHVLGVVFAASLSDTSTGYVLTARQVAESAEQGAQADDAASTGDCV
jgi:S1-C subfamily serine protease